jgi:hypothetical protein
VIDQRPATAPYYIKEGDDFLKSFEFFDTDDNPIDMSGANISFHVNGTSVATIGNGINIDNINNNIVNLAAQNTYEIGVYNYSLKVVDVDGLTQTYISGQLKVSE